MEEDYFEYVCRHTFSFDDFNFHSVDKDMLLHCLKDSDFEEAVEYEIKRIKAKELSNNGDYDSFVEYFIKTSEKINIYDHVEVDTLLRAIRILEHDLDLSEDDIYHLHLNLTVKNDMDPDNVYYHEFGKEKFYMIESYIESIIESGIDLEEIKNFPQNQITEIKALYKNYLTSEYSYMLYQALDTVFEKAMKDSIITMLSVLSKYFIIVILDAVVYNWEVEKEHLLGGITEKDIEDYPFYKYMDEYNDFKKCISKITEKSIKKRRSKIGKPKRMKEFRSILLQPRNDRAPDDRTRNCFGEIGSYTMNELRDMADDLKIEDSFSMNRDELCSAISNTI